MPKLKYNPNGRKLSDICTQDHELRKNHYQELTEIVELGGLPVIVFPTESVNGERNGQQIHWTGV